MVSLLQPFAKQYSPLEASGRRVSRLSSTNQIAEHCRRIRSVEKQLESRALCPSTPSGSNDWSRWTSLARPGDRSKVQPAHHTMYRTEASLEVCRAQSRGRGIDGPPSSKRSLANLVRTKRMEVDHKRLLLAQVNRVIEAIRATRASFHPY